MTHGFFNKIPDQNRPQSESRPSRLRRSVFVFLTAVSGVAITSCADGGQKYPVVTSPTRLGSDGCITNNQRQYIVPPETIESDGNTVNIRAIVEDAKQDIPGDSHCDYDQLKKIIDAMDHKYVIDQKGDLSTTLMVVNAGAPTMLIPGSITAS